MVDEEALYQALTTGKIAGAGLDVMVEEPPKSDHSVFKLDNAIITPQGGPTIENWPKAFRNGFDNVQRVAAGRTPMWAIPKAPRVVVGILEVPGWGPARSTPLLSLRPVFELVGCARSAVEGGGHDTGPGGTRGARSLGWAAPHSPPHRPPRRPHLRYAAAAQAPAPFSDKELADELAKQGVGVPKDARTTPPRPGEEAPTEIRQTPRGVVVTFRNVLFAIDSADLTPQARREIERMAYVLNHPQGPAGGSRPRVTQIPSGPRPITSICRGGAPGSVAQELVAAVSCATASPSKASELRP